ncbi:MAG: BPTI/Kunitz domain-containing protein [Polyangiaceae bacterium]|nr:BPTI/Kunitz domain-containing protein [Polyangiaceae bacterium]
MAPFCTGRSELLAALAIGLLEAAVPACGGRSVDNGDGGGSSAATGGRSTGSRTGSAGTDAGGGRLATESGGSATAGASAGGSGGGTSPTGGSTDQSSGSTTVNPTGGSTTGGESAADGGSAQAGETSSAGGNPSIGGIGGNGGIAGAAAFAGASTDVDCTLVGCGPAWCGEECQSPCGCCGCLEGSVDADGNRCDGGCWLRTAGDAHCRQPWDAGPCDDAIPVYWFDATTNRCEPRTYGGCEGNANRFDSLAFCEQDCAQIPGPDDELLPVVYAFGDGCQGDTLTEASRQIVTEFVAARPHDPPGDEPYLLVDLMAGNHVCARASDIVLTGTGVEAYVSYYENGTMGYLPAHQAQIPTEAVTSELGALSEALGVDPPEVDWR